MKTFDVNTVRQEVVQWIRDYFAKNGPGCNAIVGISGGKDSSVVAALCVEALGVDRVIGVLMPRGEQADIADSYTLVNHLGIRHYVVNIGPAVDAEIAALEAAGLTPSRDTTVNLPPRIRMATLFAISQTENGRVANTCNLSEDWVGYSTLFGDAAGQFSPLSHLTVQEVKALGRALGLPEQLVEKPPQDGLCGKTDEDNLGFKYAQLDEYIRTGVCPTDEATKELIDRKHVQNLFKLELMPAYDPGIPELAKH